MPIITKIREILLDFKYAKIFQIIAVYFALIYHASFLVAFGVLKIYPMFFYNIYSVILFIILASFLKIFFCKSAIFLLFDDKKCKKRCLIGVLDHY